MLHRTYDCFFDSASALLEIREQIYLYKYLFNVYLSKEYCHADQFVKITILYSL